MTATPIARIYVLTSRRDFQLTRLCAASIRYWYPDMPVSLLVDYEVGEFDTRPLEREWKLDRFQTGVRRFGWGFSRLELLFLPPRERYLVIDSDIVFLGPVLDRLNTIPGDFIVHPDEKSRARMRLVDFDPDLLEKFDPAFVLPRFLFNCGQYVGTGGLLKREDFDSVLEWSSPRRLSHPEIFRPGDQGIFNYILAKAESAGRINVAREPLFLWRKHDTSAITIEALASRTSPPLLLHWAGYKPRDVRLFERADILAFYAGFERRNLGLWTRFILWLRSQTITNWRARLGRLFWLARQSWAGTPHADGGSIEELKADSLRHFYDVEQQGGSAWRWTELAASVRLEIPRGDYHVRMETGSPAPMSHLAHSNIRFFINDYEIPAEKVRILDGNVDFDLDAPLLFEHAPQILSWKMDRLPAECDERTLGMPLSGLWVSRRRG